MDNNTENAGSLFEVSTLYDLNYLNTTAKIESSIINIKIVVIHSCNLEDFDEKLWGDIREQTEDLTSVVDMSDVSRKGYFYLVYTQDQNINFLYSNGYAVLELEVFETAHEAINRAEDRLSTMEESSIEFMPEAASNEDYMIYDVANGEELGWFNTKEEAEQTLEKWEVDLSGSLSFGAAIAPSGCTWDDRSKKWKNSSYCAYKDCHRTIGQGINKDKYSPYCEIHGKMKNQSDSNQPKIQLVTTEVKELPISKLLPEGKELPNKKGFGKVTQISKKKTKKR